MAFKTGHKLTQEVFRSLSKHEVIKDFSGNLYKVKEANCEGTGTFPIHLVVNKREYFYLLHNGKEVRIKFSLLTVEDYPFAGFEELLLNGDASAF
ncbi:MAG TPA: hypothetical protein VG621_01400 [Candidatus Paceibacterota bacterium]|nr:hypothetical protein [Candidatus Paceibacterota bacterium]